MARPRRRSRRVGVAVAFGAIATAAKVSRCFPLKPAFGSGAAEAHPLHCGAAPGQQSRRLRATSVRMSLAPAHQGYEYQDLLVACRLVDVMLDSVETVHIDEKFTADDLFDDLTTLGTDGFRERVQIKHTLDREQALALSTFTAESRRLRLDRVVSTALADRDGPGQAAEEIRFRILLRDAAPTDPRLLDVLCHASPDPGAFVLGMDSLRLTFRAEELRRQSEGLGASRGDKNLFSFLQGATRVSCSDLLWVCERLVVEVCAPEASFDLTKPGRAELLLLRRVREEVGAGVYPNEHRAEIDVAGALISCARTARIDALRVTKSELLSRTGLRVDYGAVSRRHPVDRAIEVQRPSTVAEVVHEVVSSSHAGRPLLLVGPPGLGKSWTCKQVVARLLEADWLVAEHYCFLGNGDPERRPRVLAASVFGSLVARLAEQVPDLAGDQRPRYAATEGELEDVVLAATRRAGFAGIALVVDGLDHVTRVLGQGEIDPSYGLADALAALDLPIGSVLVVLSQPGQHLEPLEEAGACSVPLPGFTESEMERLAVSWEVLDEELGGSAHPAADSEPAQDGRDEFVATLSERSGGNALYATYLCREVRRAPAASADPLAVMRGLPPYDDSLRAYYQHVRGSLGDEGGWVADVLALADFSLSRADLKRVRPDAAHRVDRAIEILRPVLLERASQAGMRIYHESFSRFLQEAFADEESAKVQVLLKIAGWLEEQGLFSDIRAYRHLLDVLLQAGRHEAVVRLVGRDFVRESLAHGFPASAVVENLATAVRSAAATDDWPAVARYVEMSRSAETYQEDRFETAMVGFVDVAAELLGPDVLADRLLHEGVVTMSGRQGLQMCAALDAMGAVPPWREYMSALAREEKASHVIYDEASDRAVDAARLRGALRLAAATRENGVEPSGSLNWDLMGKWLEQGRLDPADVVEATLDALGLDVVADSVERLPQGGACCLALAAALSRRAGNHGNAGAVNWVERAVAKGLPAGSVPQALALGADVQTIAAQAGEGGRERLLDLSPRVQRRLFDRDVEELLEWLDRCAVAARRDPLGLAAAESLLQGQGWYTCWLRFTVALAVAEAKSLSERSPACIEALEILAEVTDPFAGEPRACDLFPIHETILETIRRALFPLDDYAWEKAFATLKSVSNSLAVTVEGELGGPLPRDSLLHLAVETATPARWRAARDLLDDEIENGSAGRYYADLAGYRLTAARLALKTGDRDGARQYWREACGLLTAYGWHKDVTVFELLDPLPSLIKRDIGRGRTAVAKLQPLCARIPLHTDGKETRHAPRRWWSLLASADPCALSQLVLAGLMRSCNDPQSVRHDARSDLWKAWRHQADPLVGGALRLTLDEPLDDADPVGLESLMTLADLRCGDEIHELGMALLARADERPVRYGSSDSDEYLQRDRVQVERLNVVAARFGLPRVGQPPTAASAGTGRGADTRTREARLSARFSSRPPTAFESGRPGLASAIRTWRVRPYSEEHPDWSAERFSNVIGYRLLELLQDGERHDAELFLGFVADSVGPGSRGDLLTELGGGLERSGYGRLAAVAFTLAWTRRRGDWWRAFGGLSGIESLRQAALLDRSTALATIANEVGRRVSEGLGTIGVTQALICAFEKTSLATSPSVAFDIWREAFSVIEDRVPRVSPADDPADPYVPSKPDAETLPAEALDVAFAAATVAGLAHPSREQKRRCLVAIRLLVKTRPAVVAPALASAISDLSDPATLTWLLRAVELAGTDGVPVVAASRQALHCRAKGPHLTVRALARRLLGDEDPPAAQASEPDPELVRAGPHGLLCPHDGATPQDDAGPGDSVSDLVAGERLSRAESICPGLREAVRRRVRSAVRAEEHRHRLDMQRRAYAHVLAKRSPDIYSATHEVVEEAIQRTAAGVRGARIMNGEPVRDPLELEEVLAQSVMDDVRLPLALERTRQPRPDLPWPPARESAVWASLKGRNTSSATLEVLAAESVPELTGGPRAGWHLLASWERRWLGRDTLPKKEYDVSVRYRIVELRTASERMGLDVPPITRRVLWTWGAPLPGEATEVAIRSQPLVSCDPDAGMDPDAHEGLGAGAFLLAPGPWLLSALHSRSCEDFIVEDDEGPALALITWRAEYETSDYVLSWPRLRGSGLVVRNDAFDRLVQAAKGTLVLRDFIGGSDGLCT